MFALPMPLGHIPPGVTETVPHPDSADVVATLSCSDLVWVAEVIQDERIAGLDSFCIYPEQTFASVAGQEVQQP